MPTCTPFSRSSRWSASVHPANANFEAEYAPELARDTRPAVDATFTIELGSRAPQDGEEGLGELGDRFEVQLHVAFEVLPADVAELAAPRCSRVVHEKVEPPELGLDELRNLRRCVLFGQIDGEDRGAADLGSDRVQVGLTARNQDQLRPGLARYPLGSCLADTAGSACHECDHGAHATAGRW